MTDFSALEARVNASVVSRVANAQALFAGVPQPVTVVFDAAAERNQIGTMGIVTSSPAIGLPTASVPSSVEDMAVAVRGLNYRVAEHMADGSGWSTLYLTGGTP